MKKLIIVLGIIMILGIGLALIGRKEHSTESMQNATPSYSQSADPDQDSFDQEKYDKESPVHE